MTGFGRSDGAYGAARWHWELRAVNGRGLDVRVRLPNGYEAMEQDVRRRCSARFKRGSLNATLMLKSEGADVDVRINQQALAQVIAAAKKVGAALGTSSVSPDGVLRVKGVIETIEKEVSPADQEARQAELLASLDLALDAVAMARDREGAAIATALEQYIREIDELVGEIRGLAAAAIETAKQRLGDQVAKLLDRGAGLDEQRLHQEAVLLATRSDVEEEIKRLSAHIESARSLLTSDGAVGRKLDFLAQEFNREANTICSKAVDARMSKAGLQLKVVIDQLREQVQNVE